LQAYALQKYINTEYPEYSYNIINLRTDRQKDFYKRPYNKLNLKTAIKRIVFFGYKKKFIGRRKNFEEFISSKLNVTREYKSLDELKDADLKYDYYISGSDQLWNHALLDFDWSFFLEFCNSGIRLSYAASFGSKAEEWSESDFKRAKSDLGKYDFLSVREKASAEVVKKIIGVVPEIHADPTLLIDEEKWKELAGSRMIDGDYIFMYDLKGLKRTYDVAKKLSKRYNMPVVITRENSKKHLLYNFDKRYDAGPVEFLNYLSHAKIVVSSSFHGTVFSILFKKPFVSIDGAKDFRIKNLLNKMNLMDRAITSKDDLEKMDDIFNVDFSDCDKVLYDERMKTKKYFDTVFGK
jgi:hypothetical protein